MQPIKIKYSTQEVQEHFDFLIKREFQLAYGKYKKPLFLFLGWSVFLLLFSVIPSNSLVVLKGVLLTFTAIVFLAVMIFCIMIAIKLVKRHTWKRTAIRDILKMGDTYWLTFDEEKISFSTETYKSEINWEYYKYFLENKNTIYIFKETIYGGFSCSRSEVGDTEYENLKNIVAKRLILLDQ